MNQLFENCVKDQQKDMNSMREKTKIKRNTNRIEKHNAL